MPRLENSTAARAVRLGSELTLWLVLVIISLAVDVYSQSAAANRLVCPPNLNCSVFEPGPLGENRHNGPDGWRPFSGSKSSEIVGVMRNPLWTQEFQRLALGEKAQTQQNPPADQEQTQEKKQAGTSATSDSPGHIFWVVPAFKVDYGKGFKPLTTKEKFNQWARGAYDPLGLGAGAVEAATLEYSSTDGFCGYGPGWGGYGKCFGSLELDANVSSFTGDFALAAWWHQDPRYFRLGQGSVGRRLWYAVERVFVTYNDSGHTVFFSSALTGTAVAAGVSNLYYPQKDRGFSHSLSRAALDLGNTALYNAAAEFWPDIHRKLQHIF